MDFKKVLSDNMPLLLTSAAVAGVVSTTVLAVRATPQSLRDIWDAESDLDRKTTIWEKTRLVWKYYIPAAVVGGATIASVIGAQSLNTKRQAALVGLYSLSNQAFVEYKDKVVEKLGEKKEKDIRDEVMKDRVENDPPKSSEIIITGKGEHLCYDSITGRYFKSDIEKVRKAQNDINHTCLNDMYASLNDFYRLIGLPVTAYGEEIGWRYDNLLDISFSSHVTEDGEPALCLDYAMDPIRGYYKMNG